MFYRGMTKKYMDKKTGKYEKFTPYATTPLPLVGEEVYSKWVFPSLVLDTDTILLDDDGDGDVRLMDKVQEDDLRCIVVETDRGVHVVLRNHPTTPIKNAKGSTTLINGCVVDIKNGYSNGIQFLRKDGEDGIGSNKIRKLRLREKGGKYTELSTVNINDYYDEVDFLPDTYLVSEDVVGKNTTTTTSTTSTPAVGNRNNSLFAMGNALKGMGFDDDMVRALLHHQNERSDNPLPKEEVDGITIYDDRENQAYMAAYKDGKFTPYDLAKYLSDKYRFKYVNGKVHSYRDGMYSPIDGDREISGYLQREGIINHVRSDSRSELLKMYGGMSFNGDIETKYMDTEKILLENGVYDFRTHSLIQPSPEYILLNRVPSSFIPDIDTDRVRGIMLEWMDGNIDRLQLLLECIGYCLHTDKTMGKMMYLVGGHACGKSVCLEFIGRAIANKSTVALYQLADGDNRFHTSRLYGKLINTDDDADGSVFSKDPAILKKLCTGGEMDVEEKGKQGYSMTNYCTIICAANNPPKFHTGCDIDSIYDRMIFIPFTRNFGREGNDKASSIRQYLYTEDARNQLITLALNAYQKVLRDSKFTVDEESHRYKEESREDNNPILSFGKAMGNYILRLSRQDVYELFQRWSESNGYTKASCMKKKPFEDLLRKTFKLEERSVLIDKRTIRGYIQTEKHIVLESVGNMEGIDPLYITARLGCV